MSPTFQSFRIKAEVYALSAELRKMPLQIRDKALQRTRSLYNKYAEFPNESKECPLFIKFVVERFLILTTGYLSSGDKALCFASKEVDDKSSLLSCVGSEKAP
jgi:hypothetical protein